MKTHSAQNERIKRAYFIYLAEAQGFSESTLDALAKALNRFETYTKFRDFKAFHIEQAQGFKANLAERMSLHTKEPLSKATLYATLNALKRFFIWLAGQPRYKSRIVLRRRIFQPVGQRDQDSQGPSGGAGANA